MGQGARAQDAFANNKGRLLAAQGQSNIAMGGAGRPVDRHGLQLRSQARANRFAHDRSELARNPMSAAVGPLTDPAWDAWFQSMENQSVEGAVGGATPDSYPWSSDVSQPSQIRGLKPPQFGESVPTAPGYSARTVDDSIPLRGLRRGRR